MGNEGLEDVVIHLSLPLPLQGFVSLVELELSEGRTPGQLVGLPEVQYQVCPSLVER